ncbi:hypothetical protein EMMF5_000110 [Cystobasidiomycetes sp. EMM_F5]
MSKPKVVFVLSSHEKLGSLDKKTGWYLPEAAHPYEELKEHADIVWASPKGGKAPLDESSVEAFKDDPVSKKFLSDSLKLTENTHKLSSLVGKSGDYAALFYVGGHGPMFDIAKDETSHQLIREFAENDKVVAAVCHGPAAFAYAKLSNGDYLIKGKSVTGFSNTEEDTVQLTQEMPFKLEDALNEASGGKFVKADKDWGEKVVVENGGKLITGQNPASAAAVGKAILKAIQA